jgi:hypothetical protein
MTEYMEKHAVSRLIGAPPGYVGYDEGGQLTEAVRRRPYAVILFDEIEKAHPDVFNILLQVLDDGRLTDGKGRTVDFRNTVLIMTSNVASDLIQEMARRGEAPDLKDKLMEALRLTFRPEFLNRIDEIVTFRALGPEQIEKIVEIQMRDVRRRLAERRITVELTDEARKTLAERGYDPVFGARPLKRAIQRMIENPLAVEILAGKFREGDHITVDTKDRETFTVREGSSRPPARVSGAPSKGKAASDEALRVHLKRILDWEDAHASFDRAIAGLPPRLRGVTPPGFSHSAWQLLEHIRIAQHDILDFCVNPMVRGAGEHGRALAAVRETAVRQGLAASVAAVRRDRAAMKKLAADLQLDLFARIPHGTGQTYLREILLVADHGAYHVGSSWRCASRSAPGTASAGSLLAQGEHGVDAGRALRGQVAGDGGHQREHSRRLHERPRDPRA